MRTLYESILDSDDKIKKDAEEFSSEAGLVVRALIDTFDNKFYWDPDGVKYIDNNQRLQGMENCMFGINYSAYDKYRKLFQQTLKDYGFVVVLDKKYDKDFSIDFKGPKGHKVIMKFISFSDYTYVEVNTSSTNQKAILDLFDKYKKMKPLHDTLESILDRDNQIVHDTVEKASEIGRIVNLMVECFYNKDSWAINSMRILTPQEKLFKDDLFGINYTIYDKYHELFRHKLKELGFKITPRYTESNHKQFSVKLKGLKGHTIVIDFKAFSDYTFVEVTANDSDRKAILDLFNKYTSQRK